MATKDNENDAATDALVSQTVGVRGRDELQELLGDFDCNFRALRDNLGVKLYTKGMDVHIVGPAADVSRAYDLIRGLLRIIRKEGTLSEEDVRDRLEEASGTERGRAAASESDLLPLLPHVSPRTGGQEDYLRSIAQSEVTLCYGPAGTGKTFLSVAAAISHFKRGLVSRIVLTRPAVEAGESLGFLPGTLVEKVNPYLVPLFDALYDILGFDRARKLIERGVVEVAPLAFMRGRSLNNSFIILDEAQNTTYPQMKMFLTRMGRNSRAVVTGDITQIDLERRENSGFVFVLGLLKDLDPGVRVVELRESDVMRNPIVQRIINAYDRYERERSQKRGDEEQ